MNLKESNAWTYEIIVKKFNFLIKIIAHRNNNILQYNLKKRIHIAHIVYLRLHLYCMFWRILWTFFLLFRDNWIRWINLENFCSLFWLEGNLATAYVSVKFHSSLSILSPRRFFKLKLQLKLFLTRFLPAVLEILWFIVGKQRLW